MKATRVEEIVKLNTKIEKMKAKLKAEETKMTEFLDGITDEWKSNMVADLTDGIEVKPFEKTAPVSWKAEFVKKLGEVVAKRLVKKVGTETWLSIMVNGLNFQRKLK